VPHGQRDILTPVILVFLDGIIYNGNPDVNVWRVLGKRLQLEYLELTVRRREVGEVLVVAGRAPAC
jgi:hypothetical protein